MRAIKEKKPGNFFKKYIDWDYENYDVNEDYGTATRKTRKVCRRGRTTTTSRWGKSACDEANIDKRGSNADIEKKACTKCERVAKTRKEATVDPAICAHRSTSKRGLSTKTHRLWCDGFRTYVAEEKRGHKSNDGMRLSKDSDFFDDRPNPSCNSVQAASA